MKKYKVGYTQGVFDMLHIGHINLINHAKELCDHLIVGVNSDELVREYKHKTPVFSEEDRRVIIENLKAVDEAVIVNTLDKETALEKFRFNAIFIGDDWKGNPRWEKTGEILHEKGVDLVFLPHTEGISSTILRDDVNHTVSDS